MGPDGCGVDGGEYLPANRNATGVCQKIVCHQPAYATNLGSLPTPEESQGVDLEPADAALILKKWT